ncbi:MULTISPECIES: class I SAM-dependent methyltransferase [unclassified Solwaraspora]|uniref:class I SAM-dependent methyltransferase n=1 Tax=unclassified Solwaraspora TaxID=2627926 RepID=UPI00259AEF24|nr:50S ribosomal protein L11 methyltransferase [Solwaraspora sp. WMMA2056]WJK43809.1 50S ribosomal protein L11 methyltransferase [Solwaraspora sp. WMMA2056]
MQRQLFHDAAGTDTGGADQLRLTSVPLAAEIRLFLADDPTLLWARLEAAAGHRLPPPYWASAWAGGQALARYLLDHREVAAGRRVLDLASGSGLVAIAAAMAGAATVTANDIDPYAATAIALNAVVNDVVLTTTVDDLLDGTVAEVDLVLVGDALYNTELATRVLPFLDRLADRGVHVLVGDPGRGHGGLDRLAPIVSYEVATGAAEDSLIDRTQVLTLLPRH